MSLTSYRAAPPRANMFKAAAKQPGAPFVSRLAERNGGGLLHPAPTSRPKPQNKKPPRGVAGSGFSTLRMGSASHRQQSLATTYSSIA
jgi:hypothetical protein